MRLTQTQQQIIKNTIARVLGTTSRIWLFGSRADDALRGGDIDLLIETDEALSDRAEVLCKLYGALTFALGERKLDILLKDSQTKDALIFSIAKRTGVIL